MTPRVSVIIPTHNRAGLLREAVESVLAQTVHDWELIVVDDASTDETPDVVRALMLDGRIRSVRQDNRERGAARTTSGVSRIGTWCSMRGRWRTGIGSTRCWSVSGPSSSLFPRRIA